VSDHRELAANFNPRIEVKADDNSAIANHASNAAKGSSVHASHNGCASRWSNWTERAAV